MLVGCHSQAKGFLIILSATVQANRCMKIYKKFQYKKFIELGYLPVNGLTFVVVDLATPS